MRISDWSSDVCSSGLLEIERQVDFAGQPLNVCVGDVPAVFAQVRRNAVGAGCCGQPRRLDRIGMPSAARVSDRCNVVDVHAKTQVAAHHCPFLALTRDWSGGTSARQEEPTYELTSLMRISYDVYCLN